MLRPDQISHRLITGHKRRVDCVRGKIVSIAGAQRVRLMPNPQLELATEDPMRLIFSVRVWPVLRARRVAPLKDAIALGPKLIL